MICLDTQDEAMVKMQNILKNLKQINAILVDINVLENILHKKKEFLLTGRILNFAIFEEALDYEAFLNNLVLNKLPVF